MWNTVATLNLVSRQSSPSFTQTSTLTYTLPRVDGGVATARRRNCETLLRGFAPLRDRSYGCRFELGYISIYAAQLPTHNRRVYFLSSPLTTYLAVSTVIYDLVEGHPHMAAQISEQELTLTKAKCLQLLEQFHQL